LGLETRVNTIVVNIQIGATDGPVLSVGSILNEPLFVFAKQDIGINERTAADSAGQHGTERFERQNLKKAEQSLVWAPEVPRHKMWAAREGTGWIKFPSF
jgi:hypothetical protein